MRFMNFYDDTKRTYRKNSDEENLSRIKMRRDCERWDYRRKL